MNAYELLKTNQSVLEHMLQMAIEVSDIKYLNLYKEYLRLSGEGHKKTYIVQYLSDEYGISDRSVYRVIERFSAKVEV